MIARLPTAKGCAALHSVNDNKGYTGRMNENKHIPIKRIDQAKAAGMAHFKEMRALNPWMDSRLVSEDLNKICNANASIKSKLTKMAAYADRIAAAIAPHAACKSGCSHCCNIAVTISGAEAEMIGAKIGRKPATVLQWTSSQDEQVKKYHNVPCTFLVAGKCSIYDARPIACRLQFNLDDDEFLCKLETKPVDDCIPMVDLRHYWKNLSKLTGSTVITDIREFFM